MYQLAKVLVTTFAFFSLASAETFNVTVGSDFKFVPDHLTATTGDIIRFNFTSSIAHSVTQSTLETPCSRVAQGIDSNSISTPNTLYPVPINDNSSLYFYCKIGNHCSGRAMVFAVNVNDTTLATFKAKATGGSTSSALPASTTRSVSSTPSGTSGTVGGYPSSGAKLSVQKLTAALACGAFLVKLFL